ncbi:MAG: hypothetical protein IIB17_08935 [Chloroflexi bacterium]|nr:hypothetical protein [Chloroflexota bacterium]
MVTTLIGSRRASIDILFDVLTACRGHFLNENAIMSQCSLSNQQLDRYLNFMSARNLVESDEDGRFGLTSKGELAFDQISSACTMLQSFQTMSTR